MPRTAMARSVAGAAAMALMVGAALGFGVFDQGTPADVLAQAKPTVSPIQIPPAVPGIDYTTAGTLPEAVAAEAPSAATPVPVSSSDAAAAPPPSSGGGYSTSLGGSDVAVASEGESHQVDRPGSRSKPDREKKNRD